jgi:hypothetical protein
MLRCETFRTLVASDLTFSLFFWHLFAYACINAWGLLSRYEQHVWVAATVSLLMPNTRLLPPCQTFMAARFPGQSHFLVRPQLLTR